MQLIVKHLDANEFSKSAYMLEKVVLLVVFVHVEQTLSHVVYMIHHGTHIDILFQ